MNEADIFKALGDPIRLEIVKRLAGGSSYTIGQLSENLGVTRQGARKQLEVLVGSNLVQLSRQGRETHVVLDTKTLRTAQRFIAKLEAQWDQRLAALKALTEDKPGKPGK